jgi:hypothetical protein
LTVESFDLGDNPTVTVEAAYSKRRRTDTLPLRTEIAEALQDWLNGRSGAVWPGTWKERAAKMIRADLKVAEIEFMVNGRVFDFHALRHQFISSLAKAGVHPKTAQELSRHSTITLTMDHYSHLDRPDLMAGLNMLPALPPADWTQNGTHEIGINCPEAAHGDTTSPNDSSEPVAPKTVVLQHLGTPCLDVALIDTSSGGGTRTPDTRIMIPLL